MEENTTNLHLGDTLEIPGAGKVTITRLTDRHFWGITAAGEPYGKTAIRLAEGHQLNGITAPWKIGV